MQEQIQLSNPPTIQHDQLNYVVFLGCPDLFFFGVLACGDESNLPRTWKIIYDNGSIMRGS